jgi:hypothetical protein
MVWLLLLVTRQHQMWCLHLHSFPARGCQGYGVWRAIVMCLLLTVLMMVLLLHG